MKKVRPDCDGVVRRDFLKVGALAGTGLTLSSYLERAQAGEVKSNASAQAAIFINLSGGPTHMDTFDLKPDAPAEYRGELSPIDTASPGVRISELLPKLAQVTNHFAILRGVSHTLAAHELGTKYLNSGNRPIPSLEFPHYGAVVSHELSGDPDLPKFVAIPRTPVNTGYLGLRYGPLSTGGTPRPNQPYAVRGVSLRDGMTVNEVRSRQQLLKNLDRTFAEVESNDQLLQGMNEFSDQAYGMLTSPKAREAFDTGKEPSAVVERFGGDDFGMSCLLATRLVESGVRFVTINYGGWDMHQNVFDNLKQRLPVLDNGLSALFTTLSERGLLDSTLVYVTGEFGRTPKINARAGRDHWPRAMFSVLGGGGVRGGQVLGASDDKGQGPAGEGYRPDDVAASLFHALGIDHRQEFHTQTGRPVMIVRDGNVIPELFS